MQNVILQLRVLYRPNVDRLAHIYRTLGVDFDERALPSIVNEVLRTVIAQYNASQLLSQREQISNKIREFLSQRAEQFDIIIDDVSISDLAFSKEF